jgi:hypothetical protein
MSAAVTAPVSATVVALEDAYTDAHLFEMICPIRGGELDGAGTHDLVHREATLDEQALGSFCWIVKIGENRTS